MENKNTDILKRPHMRTNDQIKALEPFVDFILSTYNEGIQQTDCVRFIDNMNFITVDVGILYNKEHNAIMKEEKALEIMGLYLLLKIHFGASALGYALPIADFDALIYKISRQTKASIEDLEKYVDILFDNDYLVKVTSRMLNDTFVTTSGNVYNYENKKYDAIMGKRRKETYNERKKAAKEGTQENDSGGSGPETEEAANVEANYHIPIDFLRNDVVDNNSNFF